MHDGEMYPMGEPTFERPTLLSSCALATTEAEARFRIPYPNSYPRVTRVIALDETSKEMTSKASSFSWSGASFFSLDSSVPDNSENEVLLRDSADQPVRLSSLISGSDVIVMVAASGEGAAQAEVIGRMTKEQGVMSVALIESTSDVPERLRPLVAALRPSSGVLVISEGGGEYLIDMLNALRA